VAGIRSFALLALLLSGCTAAEKAMPARVEIGLPAPAYVSQTMSGDSISLASLKDKVVLLNVWATWCHPCRTEIPELKAIQARYGSRGLELVGVSVDAEGNDDGIRDFMKEFDMQYPVWRDPGERVSTQFLVIGVPATFLIDRKGILRWRKTGPIAPNDTALAGAIERALAN
jgi:cytochrome c biogenesis protein CcmG/thiol:disulfide interchange protein DsbE